MDVMGDSFGQQFWWVFLSRQGSFFQPMTPPEISTAFAEPSQKDLQAGVI